MTGPILDRPIADAVAEAREEGPRWVVAPRGEAEIGCIWARRALVAPRLFVPVLPPGETYIDDFRIYRREKHEGLLAPRVGPLVREYFAQLPYQAGSPCFVLGGSPNYYHWIVDFLPKLWLLTREPDLRGLPMLTMAEPTAMQRSTLAFACEALGMDVPRLEVTEATGFVGLTDAHFATRIFRVAAASFWRRVIERTSLEFVGLPSRLLFVTRAGADRRRLQDEAALAGRLARLGFETVDPAAMPFSEQIRTFAGARIIVGVHGAGLTNLIFARQGITVIELRAPPNTQAYRGFAAIRRQRYVEIPVSVAADGHRDEAHRDVVLSPEGEQALMRAIAEAP